MSMTDGKCNLCPRNCNADRKNGKTGYCNETNEITAARAALHFWEEPCISGKNGSGTVFFSGCNLQCVYCQNREIALGKAGKKISVDRLAEIFIELQNKNANNINLVTATHYIPEVINAVKIARDNGLCIPIVYNTSGYEKAESIKLLERTVDIYMPDFKYWECDTAKKYSNASDYPEVVKEAIAEMVRQIPEIKFNKNGIMQRGIIVRHMLIPKHVYEAKKIVDYLYKTYKDKIYISAMSQYTPMENMETAYPELLRRVTKREYERLLDFIIELGAENVFIQEGTASMESFIPSFNSEGI